MKPADFVPVWCRWDSHHGKRETDALTMAETALGMSYGLQHHEVHGVLVAWRRAGLTHTEAFRAFVAGARTVMP